MPRSLENTQAAQPPNIYLTQLHYYNQCLVLASSAGNFNGKIEESAKYRANINIYVY